ncbi:Ni-sirohydrochlorin a,c-diamide reductive cyclase ATP-dependent reductase subunit [Methanoplanus sp. FWC-SCC4]|uniref:Ni-sirohydrochlorin a,c-diamide reductive cyclase ATP-dependent reductase subunit n=1 Tax=Methanochimaera problematica TaxID=2609417 RepID=A0AA97I5B9_9EURY|nr:Ni-sirohydrochlorin a,c-diamide reductive cyclase ATP-dependent reductase subunit [Methanoplanus sp. FWC-SCC4]WOF17279.1 Ni-sirohydrochlorin a,c-diamide reductive cyclase ATP-dependent reductase subunit [Methanoplanus sp. FWC-SCC4]
MKQIALYGKGGIGKSTTSANLSAALSEKKLDIMQIGCDPKHDSTRMLMRGEWIPTVLDLVREKGESSLSTDDVVYTGYNGIRCVEAGGPEPGVGCAGRGIIATFQLLEKLDALYGDIIVYDVLGDVVCGGFAMPMREGYAQEVYLVTSGDFMALYAANNICKAIARLSRRSKARCTLGGVICNSANIEGEYELVSEFARLINSELIEFIPRNQIVRVAEVSKRTVLEYAPESEQAGVYRRLADKIMNNKPDPEKQPTPLTMDELESLAQKYIKA